MQFRASSLDSLANNLSPDEKHHTRSQFSDKDQFIEACRKGLYPYNYFTSMDRFKETKLPDQNAFKNKLHKH